uniref:Uncharacterized protein n=1 Tax=Nelumbo nucifera TaxID=4432 RepID=A0A822XGF7_NELNU|nr:TPA_asm: hypothetical protein HUJ06_020226 [Nelumbo nucifera]
MRGLSHRDRPWASDTTSEETTSGGSSPRTDYDSAEFLQVTLDLQDDDTIILRSVEPATVIDIDLEVSIGSETETPPASSRSPTIRRSSSNRLRQFSQELIAELRRFSWGQHGRASRTPSASASPPSASTAQNGAGTSSALDSVLAA